MLEQDLTLNPTNGFKQQGFQPFRLSSGDWRGRRADQHGCEPKQQTGQPTAGHKAYCADWADGGAVRGVSAVGGATCQCFTSSHEATRVVPSARTTTTDAGGIHATPNITPPSTPGWRRRPPPEPSRGQSGSLKEKQRQRHSVAWLGIVDQAEAAKPTEGVVESAARWLIP